MNPDAHDARTDHARARRQKMPRGGRKTHEHADQFGDANASLDRDGAREGGGAAGGHRAGAGGSTSRVGVAYARRELPKFLQPHAGLLGARCARDDDADANDDDGVVDVVEEDASDADERARRAAAAEEHREAGNAAFRAGRFAQAAEAYGRACAFDAADALSRSNRSAAYEAMGRYEDALADAREAGRLRPGWAKAAMREAKALAGAGRLTEAAEAWRRAVELETADDVVREKYRKALAEAEEAESRSLKEGKFSLFASAGHKKARAEDDAGEAKTKKKKPLVGALSFAEDE